MMDKTEKAIKLYNQKYHKAMRKTLDKGIADAVASVLMNPKMRKLMAKGIG